jgi:hypothetical protein
MTSPATPPSDLRTPEVHPSAAPPPPGRVGRRLGGWVVLTALSLAVTAAAVTPYLVTDLAELARAGGGLASNYVHRAAPIQVALYVHVVAGGLALLLAPWQFSARLRRRAPQVHRAAGRTAGVAIAVASLAGLVIAQVSRAGLIGALGFSTLSLLWAYAAWRTYRTAAAGDFAGHRDWAVRTFALTFAAVTLRVWLGLLIGVEIGVLGRTEAEAFDVVYPLMPFGCWVPNLVVAEVGLRRARRSRRI